MPFTACYPLRHRFCLLGAILITLCACASVAPSEGVATADGEARSVPCPTGVPSDGRCLRLSVPERYDGASERDISLLIIRFPAQAPTPLADPALVLVGGPGQASHPLAGALASRFAAIRATRDLILVDQRGTGGSNRLPCVSGAAADPARAVGPVFTTEEISSCATTLAARADLAAYTTVNSAIDLDRVREALGIAQWTVLGGSYGTKVALEYARAFPAATRALVLEGVAGPEYPNPLPHARAGQAALDSLFLQCNRAPACSAAYPDLARRFDRLLARLDSAPATVSLPGRSGPPLPFGREELSYGLHLLLFSNQTAPAVPFLLARAADGDFAPIANVVAQVTTGLASQIDFGMQLSVTCAEDAPMFTRADAIRETAGTYLGGLMAEGVLDECSRWPVAPGPPLEVAALDVPALLLSGAFDAATPLHFAQSVAARLPRSLSLLIPYGAHVTVDPCVNGIVAEYVATLAVAPAARACLQAGSRPPFLVPGG